MTQAIHEHYCQHEGCKKWGGFGFDRPTADGKVTDWWCWEHYPYKDPPKSRRDVG